MGACIGQRQTTDHPQQPPTDSRPQPPPPQSTTTQPNSTPANKPPLQEKAPPTGTKEVLPPSQNVSKIEIKLQTNQSSTLRLASTALDENCHMIKSYVNENNLTFWKEGYNWHSLPIKSPIDIKVATIFTLKNVAIKYNHFMAGVIAQTDLHALTPMPWKTQAVICYESCNNNEGSWIRHGEGFALPVKDVKVGSILSVVVRDGSIEFWIDKEFQGRTDIPLSMLQKPLLPYIATFCSGDAFQILPHNPLVPYNPPQ